MRARRAAGVVALLLLPLSAPGAAGSAGAVVPEPESPVAVEVVTLAPRAPQTGGRLQVRGTLTNTGSSPVQDLRVALRVGDRLRSRSELAEADDEGVATRRVPGTVLSLLDVVLAPGTSAPFDLRTDVDELRLGGDGAYPLEVEVRGRVDRGSSGIVGLASTFLPWFASPPSGTTRLAFVWPLVTPPVAGPRRTDRGPVLLDERLAEELAPQGRLGRSLRAARGVEEGECDRPPADAEPSGLSCRGEPVPLAYALDADLLDTAVGMAGGYDVRVSESRLRAGTGSAAAADWVRRLKEGVATGEVLALPYADPDVVALTEPGSPLAGDVGNAVQLGRRAVAAAAGADPLPSLTLAPPGALTVDALQAYAGSGTRTLVVTEDALPPRPPTQGRTSGTRNPLSSATGPLTGLVVDDALSRLLVPDPDDAGWQGPRLAEQRFLVETAMVSAEEPTMTRTLVVAPARDAEVVPPVAAQSVLDAGRLPWLCPVRLSDVVAGREQCPTGGPVGAAEEDRGAPVVPDDDAPLLGAEQLERVAQARADVDQLTGAVLAPSEQAARTQARLLRAALRAESLAWRTPSAQRRGRTLARLLQDDVDDLLGRVKLLTGPVTLTSSRGQVTVDVENQLDQAVTVRVRVLADNAARLAVQGAAVQAVPPRTSVPLGLEAEPRTSGQFPVRAQLLDRRGRPFGAPSEFVIRSTRYGPVALAVTGVGAGVLLVAAGYRLVRRALGR